MTGQTRTRPRSTLENGPRDEGMKGWRRDIIPSSLHPHLRRRSLSALARGALLAAILATACNGEKASGGTNNANASDGSKPKTAFSGDSALAYVRAQMAFGNRIPGTDAHRRTADWIVEQMRQRADTVIVQSWTHTTVDGKALPLRNVFARFRPDAAERVLYLAHWDTRPISENAGPADRDKPVPGANDGASGVAILLGVADVLKKTPPAYGVDLLFVDGEDYGDFTRGKDVFMGSRYFAEHLPSADYRPLFGVVWDMVGDADLQIYHEGNSVQFAPEVVARVWQQAEDLGYSRYFVQQARHTIDDDHLPLQRKGLRVIDVIDFDFPDHHRPTDTLDKVSARSLQIVGDVAVKLVTSK